MTKTLPLPFLILILVSALFLPASTRGANDGYGIEASENGAEKFILMHSRMGIRIEYNLSRQLLNLWISPQAGKNTDYRLRNFSNRDDHTNLFERITFPQINPDSFVSCDYDPFHSVINFTNQKVHILSLLDQPAIVVWCEKPEQIDFKSDKADSPLERSPFVYSITHPDRGLNLCFAASLSKGGGSFQHQREIDEGRSIYARAHLQPGQFAVIAGELAKERVTEMAQKIAARPLDSIIVGNEKAISAATDKGVVTVKGYPEIQKLADINRRILLSAQDASGAIRASTKYIYYLIWNYDGSITTAMQAAGGWVDPLRLWVGFALGNPTVAVKEQPGRYFGQLINGKLSKRQTGQIHPIVWAAFNYWSQTGDTTYARGKYLRALDDAIEWMERYSYDKDLDMFFSIYRNENPYYGSYDFGWDEAIGRPMTMTDGPQGQGENLLRSISAGMNSRMYDVYMMMSAMTTGKKSDFYFAKALERKQLLWRLMGKTGEEPFGGYTHYQHKGVVKDPPGGQSRGGGSQGFFSVEYSGVAENRSQNFDRLQQKVLDGKEEVYSVSYFSSLAGLDPEFNGGEKFWEASKFFMAPNITPTKYLPMPYTMTEMFNMPPGSYHDNRPQFFTIGAFQGALAHQGIKRLALGVALRGTNHLAKIDNYQYKKSLLSIVYKDTGVISGITMNGKPLEYTLQIPEDVYKPGRNDIEVKMGTAGSAFPVLVYSTIRLESVSRSADSVYYQMRAFGSNCIIIKNAKQTPRVFDTAGKETAVVIAKKEPYTTVEFEGRGRFTATLAAN